MADQIRAELLGNGLIRVFDYGPKWAAVYDLRGKYQFGPAPDLPKYRPYVARIIAGVRGEQDFRHSIMAGRRAA